MHERLGSVVIAVFDGCPFDTINEAEPLRQIVVEACISAGAQVLHSRAVQFYQFEKPEIKDGASAIAVLAESHAAGHSWPRRNQLVCVVYTCGEIDPLLIARKIGKFVEAKRFKVEYTNLDELVLGNNVPWVDRDT